MVKKVSRFLMACAALASLSACGQRQASEGPQLGAQTPRYALIALGEFTEKPNPSVGTFAVALNDASEVVGSSWGRAFLWTDAGGMQDLGALPGETASYAKAVNATGHIVGDGEAGAFLWSAAGGMLGLSSKVGFTGEAHAINDAGLIGGANVVEGFWKAAVWSPESVLEDPGFPGILNDINSFGAAAAEMHGPGGPWAANWTAAGGPEKLGALPGGDGTGVSKAINNAGQVVGVSYVPSAAPQKAPGSRAFLWTPEDGMRDLGQAPGLTGGQLLISANDINDKGQIVGDGSDTHISRAFIWDAANGMRDLNDLIAPVAVGATPVMYSALAINNKGEITAYSYENGKSEAYLLRPIE